MGVALLTDQHHGKLLAIKPFDESGLYPIGSPAPLVVPGGLCLDSQGNVIITDSGNHCLVVRDLWSDSWQSYGTRGAGQGEFSAPSDVAANSNNGVYVVDAGNRRLVAWMPWGAANGMRTGRRARQTRRILQPWESLLTHAAWQ